MKTTTSLRLRRMRLADLQQVMEIERACFPNPWCQQEFEEAVAKSYFWKRVIVQDDTVLGYIVWEWIHGTRNILNVAVHPDHQRAGIGRALVQRVLKHLTPVQTQVRETNLGAQLFLRQLGFRCYGTMKRAYDGFEEDAYLFEHANAFPAT